ncbi:hypothetical protein C5167_007781 [Papaver somniferum]|uniref:nitrate regulatory gene2 protein-like n=1 Tax=Papaver somniferum TaxID=3469 RepID=UPI000E6FE125|nr:nitrate regulatory gene2 protein-like [Papaver somniferum]XP_026429491.1 nitrate regulatory gene2 protein-like [Papaver somniferum]RZC85170.1 hypothetical protein C5167_007781 [Papaver somniferum]
MGVCSSSRIDKSEALCLCKERKRLIKQAIDSRYALSASHLCYIQSLRNIGIALRRFAQAEMLIESSPLSLSSATNNETDNNAPSPHSSLPSPSPIETSPMSAAHSNISYMRLSGGGDNAAVTVKFDPNLSNSFIDGESLTFHPPPPPPGADPSWDFFQPNEAESFRFGRDNGLFEDHCFEELKKELRGEEVVEPLNGSSNSEIHSESVRTSSENGVHEISVNKVGLSGQSEAITLDKSISMRAKPKTDDDDDDECMETMEREDPSDFITHRAKDFLSSIKDIEHKFFRASESGKEVSRLLEADKIRLDYCEGKGRSPASVLISAFNLACCQGETVLPNVPIQNTTKVITWNRSTSSQSSSSRNPLASASKDDMDDSGSDFLEEFNMIAGSHSSTLDRLYAWERKLFDEVKASEYIRKEYEQKCDQLRHQFAKDVNPYAIDKTRAIVKDLHSRIRVALHAVDSIAKRIEKLRDEELQPQLVELIRGLIRMWKVMLECHHTQYITISLAYHVKNSTMASTQGESYKLIVGNLQHEIEYFESNFVDWISAYKSYVEALNGWLQLCIVLPPERSRARRSFSPRRALAPPIFVLSGDWSAGIKTLPSEELKDAIRAFASELQTSIKQIEEYEKTQESSDLEKSRENEDKEDGKCDKPSNLRNIHTSLTKALDRLTKFAEASLKMYVQICKESETARKAYGDCMTNT